MPDAKRTLRRYRKRGFKGEPLKFSRTTSGKTTSKSRSTKGRATSAAARKRNAARKLRRQITKKAPPGRAKKSKYTR